MRITNYNQNTQFQGIVFTPKFSSWDKDILNAVLDSETIKNIIEEDAKTSCDTFIKYQYESPKTKLNGPIVRNVLLKVTGHKNDVELNVGNKTQFVKGNFFTSGHMETVGPIDLKTELIERIRQLDKPADIKQAIFNKLERLKNTAGNIRFV